MISEIPDKLVKLSITYLVLIIKDGAAESCAKYNQLQAAL